ncbi:hypothetical protein ABHV46_08025 [Asaia sp. BMEF1]|uniref:FitA-like ribbon-helix-helix domain-containing protein n=1 Tax=Asaia sp. BMEF1 TaxID=3155932 RepID=UPI003F66CB97
MAQFIIRNLDGSVHEAIRQRAARHGYGLEAEVREILSSGALEEVGSHLGAGRRSRMAARFEQAGFLEREEIEELKGTAATLAAFD